ncbi:prefoldin subunit 6, partial [Diplocarpon rosae]
MAEAQQQLQALSEEYQKLQQDLQKSVTARQKLESQQQENKAVHKEFGDLGEDANIYKMVGPVLLKQDKTEAVMAVNGRLEFIENEIKRIEKQISDVEGKSDAVRQQ